MEERVKINLQYRRTDRTKLSEEQIDDLSAAVYAVMHRFNLAKLKVEANAATKSMDIATKDWAGKSLPASEVQKFFPDVVSIITSFKLDAFLLSLPPEEEKLH